MNGGTYDRGAMDKAETAGEGFELLINPQWGTPGVIILSAGGFTRAKATITGWTGYAPTPLLELPQLATEHGVASLRIKNEANRFGLGSFKALGGAYAVAALLTAELARRGVAPSTSSAELADGRFHDMTATITVTCATDGNHGRSVAWGARRFHCRCVIFVHETVTPGRVDAIAAFGAKVVRVAGNYDDAVREADRQAKENGWFVVSDTSYPGYTEVPRDVMQGYRLMADEAADQWSGPPPTHVFMQAGVGGAAAAVSIQMRARFKPVPTLVIVEPDNAACLMASARAGTLTTVHGRLETIMAGLACGEPSLLAWQELARAAAAFMSIPDTAAIDCLRLLAGQNIPFGESGVAGLAAFMLVATSPMARINLGLTATSRVLMFGTEGITDRQRYSEILRPR